MIKTTTLIDLNNLSFAEGLHELNITVDMLLDMKKQVAQKRLADLGVVNKIPAKEALLTPEYN